MFYCSYYNQFIRQGFEYKIEDPKDIKSEKECLQIISFLSAKKVLKNEKNLHQLVKQMPRFAGLFREMYYKIHYEEDFKINYDKYANMMNSTPIFFTETKPKNPWEGI